MKEEISILPKLSSKNSIFKTCRTLLKRDSCSGAYRITGKERVNANEIEVFCEKIETGLSAKFTTNEQKADALFVGDLLLVKISNDKTEIFYSSKKGETS